MIFSQAVGCSDSVPLAKGFENSQGATVLLNGTVRGDGLVKRLGSKANWMVASPLPYWRSLTGILNGLKSNRSLVLNFRGKSISYP